jgi:PadR family transcriptional regulator, regulatory protein PadR
LFDVASGALFDLGKIRAVTHPMRITGPLLDVLEVFLQAFNDGVQLHGWAITKITKRSGPTVYGVLDRLEHAAWITGQWEDQHPASSKPRRRLYRLTPTGLALTRDLLAARRPQGPHHHLQPYRVWPEPGPVFIGWLRNMLPGSFR